MKNKNAEQKIRKKEHLAQLKKANRRTQPNIERKEATLEEKPTILIACEGANTEPSYFGQFRLSTATIKVVGEGYNTISLVKRAVQLKKKGDYDQVWCVFDKDDFADADFLNAMILAEKNNIQVAYSNQAFEYWIILHFEDHQGGKMNRADYGKKIQSYLKACGVDYCKKSKIITDGIFDILEQKDTKTKKKRIDLAIARADKIYSRLDQANIAKAESSTTVFKLVKELLKYK